MLRKIYQTLEDRDNPDDIERLGPFPGDTKLAWLGSGYYFWEYNIEYAHWWGGIFYRKNGYVICESSYDYNLDRDEIFDLDQPEYEERFIRTWKMIEEMGKVHPVTVPAVIDFLEQNIKPFQKYKAIRVRGVDSVSSNYEPIAKYRVPFEEGKRPYLDLLPPVQLCVINKSILHKGRYSIVYPEKYVEEYLG